MNVDKKEDRKKVHKTATLGGGCFWCLEAAFSELEGVEKVQPGYSGGRLDNPTYEQVCTNTTGHAEVVQIVYDPTVVSYEGLLDVFFFVHDPTTLNRQGGDIGEQYRSVIFYHTKEQKAVAREKVRQLEKQKTWRNPIVTQIVPLERFYEAEGYHKGYYRLNSEKPYCRAVIAPKLSKLRTKHRFKLIGSDS